MTKRMLIDATHAEETRVVVLDGNRLEDFDVETSAKAQLKGNIYLAKIVRVEPSLQAAFVEYGGGRHGFLAFGEIHPDYYQIPVADRQRLLKMQAEEARAEEGEDDDEPAPPKPAAAPPPAKPASGRGRRGRSTPAVALSITNDATAYGELSFGAVEHGEARAADGDILEPAMPGDDASPIANRDEAPLAATGDDSPSAAMGDASPLAELRDETSIADDQPDIEPAGAGSIADEAAEFGNGEGVFDAPDTASAPPEVMGGESDVFEGNGAEEAAARRTSRFLRSYRIQEVIRRRQIILIQVVKEERGTKGAALTTYISLAGRFCVLMPNSPRGGGISRKITSAADRRRLKEITAELEIPNGMGLIVRTAGANRPKPEIRRDCEYLMRLWDDIREHTLRSMAPALIYEEASLIKRAIRDGYSRDIDEVVVDGEAGWRAAHDFMRMLMPSHAKKVQLWRANGVGQPLFAKHGVEDQLDSMLSPTVQLKSGGYLVINQAEALVAIDVNSGRSTRERGIEETALRTNLEAAEEAARQLRLRDLAGLIVIDFIDMESKKNNAMVERRLKEALKNDRARIQVGQISHFGLMEMSRQRLRPSLTEASFVTCPHCAGLGLIRNVDSSAIHVLRHIEDEGAKARAGHIMVHVANSVAMYLLNNKRDRLGEIEQRYAMRVHFSGDDTLVPPLLRIDRLRPPLSDEERAALAPPPVAPAAPVYEMGDEEEADDWADEAPAADAAAAPATPPRLLAAPDRDVDAPALMPPQDDEDEPTQAPGAAEDAERRPRRRRRRGGRREAGDENGSVPAAEAQASPADAAVALPMHDGERPDGMALVGESGEPARLGEPATPIGVSDPAGVEQPSLDPENLDENGLPRARRRGRRGGKRRGREDGVDAASDAGGESATDAVAAPAAAPPSQATQAAAPSYVAPPAYAGPTPANPFGGQPFDIFDILERAEEAEAERVRLAAMAPVPVAIPVPVPVPVPVAVQVAAPMPSAGASDLAIPPVPANAARPPDIAVDAVPSAPAEVQQAIAELAPAIPVAPVAASPVEVTSVVGNAAASGPIVGPAVQPVVIGEGALPATVAKRGWWKR